MTINVAGQRWPVREFDPNARNDNAMGRSDSVLGEISISSALSGDRREETLIHEWIHGTLDAFGVEHSEAVVCTLAVELFRAGFRVPLLLDDPEPSTRKRKPGEIRYEDLP